MTSRKKTVCPKCGSQFKHYDMVKRIVRSKWRQTEWGDVERKYCPRCGTTRRQLPENLLPYKQYEAEIVYGVLEGLITPDTLGFEDYPCEMTMSRWITQNSQGLLRR